MTRARRRPAALLLALLVAALAAPSASTAAPPTASESRAASPPVVRTAPCPDHSIFTCITIRVPRDHVGSSAGKTFDVTFALHKAKRATRKGVFVTVTGGAGTSGIAAADSYTAAFDPRIVRDYDIVFFDQRGIGLSEPIQCPDASLEFYLSPYNPIFGPEQARGYARDSEAYPRNCLEESGTKRSTLPYFSTKQAVEDLEAFRVWLKADKLDLYGESYGTQYVQTYAAAHPNRLKSLMLDGSVDLTKTVTEYYGESIHDFEDTLVMTLDRCTADRGCRRDALGADALDGYDALAAKLKRRDLPFTFVDDRGREHRRTFSFGDLETAASGYVYTETDRMIFQRAIAWALRGDLLPLARLRYISLGQDPETLEAIPDPTWSDGMYYAVECMDYAFGSGTPDQRARQYLAAGHASDAAEVRLGSVFYTELPCAYWPVHPATDDRPDYLTNTTYPVFVLASTTDPATPYANALRIKRHLNDGYLITQPGGPHILFGRGNACTDDPITAFLVSGTRPTSRSIRCDFTGTDPYVRIPAARVHGYRDALAAMTAMDDEINYSADYWAWYGIDDLVYGCQFGGTIRYHPIAAGYGETLTDCEFTAGLPLTGTAVINDNRGTFRLDITSTGGTKLTYRRDADGNTTVKGTWFGEKVSLAG